MITVTLRRHMNQIVIVLFTLSLSIILVANIALAHGGKKHDSDSFTRLKALQKATGLYDQLIAKGKLEESWETELKTVEVSIRENKGMKEFVVSFKRNKGNHDTVYFFFEANGKYAGSNFSGK